MRIRNCRSFHGVFMATNFVYSNKRHGGEAVYIYFNPTFQLSRYRKQVVGGPCLLRFSDFLPQKKCFSLGFLFQTGFTCHLQSELRQKLLTAVALGSSQSFHKAKHTHFSILLGRCVFVSYFLLPHPYSCF